MYCPPESELPSNRKETRKFRKIHNRTYKLILTNKKNNKITYTRIKSKKKLILDKIIKKFKINGKLIIKKDYNFKLELLREDTLEGLIKNEWRLRNCDTSCYSNDFNTTTYP